MSSTLFPLLTKSTYLNTAYVGPMSTALAQFRQLQEKEYLEKGATYKVNAYDDLDTTHHILADFFGAKKEHTYVVSNFSTGIRQALTFLSKSLNVLLLEEEYPSLSSAFEESGFEVHKIPKTTAVEDAIEKRLATGGIDVLALSIVQYDTGLLIDLEFLKKIKKNYPNLILIGDGTQFLGGHFFHFDRSPFDLVVASGYKWLLAGFGNGVLMVSSLFLKSAGCSFAELHQRIFNGHFNILAAASLRFAIESFRAQGFEKLLDQKIKLSEKVKTQLTDKLYIEPWVAERKQHSSIFILKGGASLYEKLQKNNIQCALRGTGVRISFHYYNTESDLNHLISILKKS
jgi:cysteine desulfurase/selenocysteine lyase